MTSSPLLIVLWDIDGTLVDVRGNGRKAFAIAVARTWGVVDDLAGVTFLGGTDLDVLAFLRARHGALLDARHDARFFDVLHDALDELLATTPALAMPGAADAVDAIEKRGAAQGLVTGNGKRSAYRKLASAGLDVARFPFGGFGDEHGDRNELATLALSRARARRAARSSERVVLVGDTPNDIRAAHHVGAVAVALASPSPGRGYDRAALEGAGADVVVDDLRDVAKLVA